MKELSLNILDISQNSITAGASLVEISLTEDENGWLTLAVKDDGCGMSEETL
ncbi:MAG: sensor histidine kinase, partial [Clostridia bacterium]|nr:sensor histidine kinase [Clostridia bacterium]